MQAASFSTVSLVTCEDVAAVHAGPCSAIEHLRAGEPDGESPQRAFVGLHSASEAPCSFDRHPHCSLLEELLEEGRAGVV